MMAALSLSVISTFAFGGGGKGGAVPPAAPVSDSAMFKFDVDEYNFGTINQGDVVNYDFKFTNAGKQPIIITEAHGSCGCTAPDWPKTPIKQGEKSVIKVTFNSAGKSGMQDKTVTINSSAKNSPYVIHLKGTVNVPEKKEVAPAVPANPPTPAPTPAPAPAPVPVPKK